MLRSAPIACALDVLILVTSTAVAQRDEKAPMTQAWSVTFAEDTAVIRASKETEGKFVQATIKTLQQKGVEKFVLHSQKTTAHQIDDRSIAIRLHNGEAELSVSIDLPYKHVVGIVSMLADNGVRKIKFAQPKSNKDPAKRREAEKAR